jgi:hypothetical protein
MPERWGNAPKTNRNIQDPKIQAASLPQLLPNSIYLQHCDITNQVGDCACMVMRVESAPQLRKVKVSKRERLLHKVLFPTLDVMT